MNDLPSIYSRAREALSGTLLKVPKIRTRRDGSFDLERVPGSRLSELNLDEDTILLVKALILLSLPYLHEKGIHHGNLIKDNVLFDQLSSTVYLVGFGTWDKGDPLLDYETIANW